MSYFDFNILQKIKKKKNKKENNDLLFPKTYKNILLLEGFPNNKNQQMKTPSKNNIKFIIKKQNEKKETDYLKELNKNNFNLNLKIKNILPKIKNSNSNLSKFLKHNYSATECVNNKLNIDYNKNKIHNNNSKNISKNVINDYSYDNSSKNNNNNSYFLNKVDLNRKYSEIMNSYNNSFDKNSKHSNNSNKVNKNEDNEYIKTVLYNNDNILKIDSKNNEKTENLFGSPVIKKSNPLNLQSSNSNSKINSYNDKSNNKIGNDDYKLKSQLKEYYKALNKQNKKDKPVKIENLSITNIVRDKKKKKNNLNKIKTKCPEELHFYYILMVQEGKKMELEEN